MKVIRIHKESYGFIGLAKNMDSAFRFLVEKKWIDELWDEDTEEYVDPNVLIEKYNAKNLLDLLKILYEKDDTAFEDIFYFCEEDVFE